MATDFDGGDHFELEDYEVTKCLGAGSFGMVRLGVHKKTKKYVAIKLITRGVIINLSEIERASREFYILQTLEHPNIIKLHDVIQRESGKKLFVVMEYADGGSLGDMLQNIGHFGEKRARRFFQQLVKAVRYCHRKHVVHRDLKPDNVLLSRGDHVKVADFGLSNTVGLSSQGGRPSSPVGTPLYSAPEVLFRSDFDEEGRIRSETTREFAKESLGAGASVETGRPGRPHRHQTPGAAIGAGAGGGAGEADRRGAHPHSHGHGHGHGQGHGHGAGTHPHHAVFEYDPNPTDIWSLGVILYQMVYGRLPFPARSKKDLRERVLGRTLVLPANAPPVTATSVTGKGSPAKLLVGSATTGSGSGTASRQDGAALSRPLRALIHSMLEVEPRHRATIDQVHSHLWLAGGRSSLPSMMLSPSAETAIEQVGFAALDRSRSGSVSKDTGGSTSETDRPHRDWKAHGGEKASTSQRPEAAAGPQHEQGEEHGLAAKSSSVGGSDQGTEAKRPRRQRPRAQSQLNEEELLRARGHMPTSPQSFIRRIELQREANLKLYDAANLGVDLDGDSDPLGLTAAFLASASDDQSSTPGSFTPFRGSSHASKHATVGHSTRDEIAAAPDFAVGSSPRSTAVATGEPAPTSPQLPSLPIKPGEGIHSSASSVQLQQMGAPESLGRRSVGNAAGIASRSSPRTIAGTTTPDGSFMAGRRAESPMSGLVRAQTRQEGRRSGHGAPAGSMRSVGSRHSMTQPPSPTPKLAGDSEPAFGMPRGLHEMPRPASADHVLQVNTPPKRISASGIGLGGGGRRAAIPQLQREGSHGSASRPSTASSAGSQSHACGILGFGRRGSHHADASLDQLPSLTRKVSSASIGSNSDSKPPTTPSISGRFGSHRLDTTESGSFSAAPKLRGGSTSVSRINVAPTNAGRLGAMRPVALQVPSSPAGGLGLGQRGAQTSLGKPLSTFGARGAAITTSQTPTVLRRVRAGRMSAPDQFSARAATFDGASGQTAGTPMFDQNPSASRQHAFSGPSLAPRSVSSSRQVRGHLDEMQSAGSRTLVQPGTRKPTPGSDSPGTGGAFLALQQQPRSPAISQQSLRGLSRIRRPSLRSKLGEYMPGSGSEAGGTTHISSRGSSGSSMLDSGTPVVTGTAGARGFIGRGVGGSLRARPLTHGSRSATGAPSSVSSKLAALRARDAATLEGTTVSSDAHDFESSDTGRLGDNGVKSSWSDRLYEQGVQQLRTKGKFFGTTNSHQQQTDEQPEASSPVSAAPQIQVRHVSRPDAVDRLVADASFHRDESKVTVAGIGSRTSISGGSIPVVIQAAPQRGKSRDFHQHESRTLAGAGAQQVGLKRNSHDPL